MSRKVLSFFLSLLLLLVSTTVSANSDIDARTNLYRAANGLTELATDGILQDIAATRAREIAAQWPLWSAELHVQWIYGAMGCMNWGGENLAYSSDPANDFAEDWYNSLAGHRQNMLNPVLDSQGSAVYHDPNTGYYFAVQVFRDSCDDTGTTGSGGSDTTGTGPGEVPTAPQGSSEPQVAIPVLPDTSTLAGTKDQ